MRREGLGGRERYGQTDGGGLVSSDLVALEMRKDVM
jgi:hypothetical protein